MRWFSGDQLAVCTSSGAAVPRHGCLLMYKYEIDVDTFWLDLVRGCLNNRNSWLRTRALRDGKRSV